MLSTEAANYSVSDRHSELGLKFYRSVSWGRIFDQGGGGLLLNVGSMLVPGVLVYMLN